MQATPCPKTMVFSEGTMERAFLNLKFPRFTVIPVDNGDSWTTERMCEQIVSKYQARKTLPDALIIWFDREKNVDTPLQIETALRAAFSAIGFPLDRLHCLIPDRMSENIILSDETLMQAEVQDPSYLYQGDGIHGKGALKAIFKTAGVEFKETTHGTRLLSKVRLSRCAVKNKSVHSFLSTFKTPCWII